jgi:hypothetical protein
VIALPIASYIDTVFAVSPLALVIPTSDLLLVETFNNTLLVFLIRTTSHKR